MESHRICGAYAYSIRGLNNNSAAHGRFDFPRNRRDRPYTKACEASTVNWQGGSALVWSDLNSTILVGAVQVFDHEVLHS